MMRVHRAFIATLLLLCNQAWSDDGTILDADRAEATINKGDRALNSAAADAYLATVITRLQKSNPDFPAGVRIRALKTPLPTVLVLGNGATYASAGLLEKLENESQLALLLAAEIATWSRRDDLALTEKKRKNAVANGIGSIFLVAITAGLAAPALISNENAQTIQIADGLRRASDIQGLKWIQAAGYSIADAATTLNTLRAALETEQRLSPFNGPLANEADLKKRSTSLEHAAGEIQRNNPAAPAATEAIDPTQFAASSKMLLRWQIAVELDDMKRAAFFAEVDRYESRFGVSGETSCLRAAFSRLSMRIANEDDMNATLSLYAKCTGSADAPASAYRELGFLHRQHGNIAAAKQALKTYLEKAPNAVDAPIVRSYIGEN